jgi:hypothetical protein
VLPGGCRLFEEEKKLGVGKKPWNPTRPTNPADLLTHPPARPLTYIRMDTDTDILNIRITDG